MSFGSSNTFRYIFILDSRDWFDVCRDQYDPASDLILTYDLALKHEIEEMGGKAFYADHLIDQKIMQDNNFLIYNFFREWHCDANGKDIFEYRGVPFGFSFRLEFWNDYVFYVRARLCLEELRKIAFAKIFVGTKIGVIEEILGEMGVAFLPVRLEGEPRYPTYYFPIHDWMSANIRRCGIKAHLLSLMSWGAGSLLAFVDRKVKRLRDKPSIAVQDYHPTRKLIRQLRQESWLRVIATSISRKSVFSRYIPIRFSSRSFESVANQIMQTFRVKRCARIVLTGGVDVTESIYRIIERRIEKCIAESIRTLDSIVHYLDRNPIQMELLIANVGDVVSILDCACKARGIPRFLIINGWMGGDFLDESKYATVINAYSVSIKEHYFRGMNNVVCLGDPRMDAYAPLVSPKKLEKGDFTITIGASGHNNADLNSYVAVEFDFMHDVLHALSIIRNRGIKFRIVIKVRANGYRHQYESFAKEFFPGLVDEIVDDQPMKGVLERTDFYISICSQTLIEAACLGIPCLYYKKDSEILDPPFDGCSELVTVDSVEELVQAVEDFRAGHVRYAAFMQQSVLEKYIGYLDGKNLERNLRFIYEQLRGGKREKNCEFAQDVA